MTAPPPAHNVSPLQFTVPKLVRRQPPRVWLPLAVLMFNTLLLLTVTTAPFHAPDCQVKTPWMTFRSDEIGKEAATESVVAAGRADVQHAVAAYGHHRAVPRAGLPGQNAVDDIRPDQKASVLNHVGARDRAVDIEIAAGEISRPRAVGGDVAAGEVAGALEIQNALLHVHNTGVVEGHRVSDHSVTGIISSRFAERAEVVEDGAGPAVKIVQGVVVLRVP